MTWLTPGLAALAGAIAIPTLLILYFLKLRRRDVEVSTTLLWRKAIQDLQANAPFQKLRRNILLILQLLVLAALLFALAQPQMKGLSLSSSKHVIMIDRSASMTALDESDGTPAPVSRLEAARKQANDLVDQLREEGFWTASSADEAMVIAFDTQAEVRQTFTGDKRLLKQAIDSITGVEGPTAIEEAMRLARAHAPRKFVEGQAIEGLDSGDPLQIHVYSDGRLPDSAKAKPGPNDLVVYHRLGKTDSPNVGVTSMRAERSFDNPAKLSVHIGLSNATTSERTVEVELLLDGEVSGIKSTVLSAAKADESAKDEQGVAKVMPGNGGVIFQLDRMEGALVAARLREPDTGEGLRDDVLALDNRAWTVVPPAKRLAVAVVSDRADRGLLLAVLEGLPLSRLTELTSKQYEDLARREKLGEYDVIVLDSYLPPVSDPDAPGLPPGRFLVINAVPAGTSGLVDEGDAGATGIVDWVRDHPVLRGISLDSMLIAQSRKISLKPGSISRAIAWAEQGPSIVEITKADTRAIVVTFDVIQTNWPFDAGFVVFFGSAIRSLGDDASSGVMPRSVQPGSVLSDRIPSDATNVEISVPGGTTQRLIPAPDGRIVFGPIARTGVYEARWSGTPGPTDVIDDGKALRVFTSNLGDPDESNVASEKDISLATQIVAASSERVGESDRRLWPWLVLAALLIIMLEWFVYNRKVHI